MNDIQVDAPQPVGSPSLDIALNVGHRDSSKAADAFWQYWRENGIPHKHGYYESTWGAINQALRHVGVVPHDYAGHPRDEVRGTTYLEDCIRATPTPPESAAESALCQQAKEEG
jgi:hypothetical protein